MVNLGAWGYMYSLSNDAFILGHGTVWTGDFVAIFLIKENWTAVYNRLGLRIFGTTYHCQLLNYL